MSTVDADLLSIVIPAFNAASTIGAMLESLAQQSASVDWEVVVAENGSTDATRALVATYCDRLPSLRIVDASASSGAAYARNLGVREAKGDQIVFLDADDEVGTDFIQAVSRALTRGPQRDPRRTCCRCPSYTLSTPPVHWAPWDCGRSPSRGSRSFGRS